MSVDPVVAPGGADIDAARERLAPYSLRSPVVELATDSRRQRVYLKLENLQPFGVFKVRCIANEVLALDLQSAEERGLYTASSGNAGLGLAWMAARLGLPARIYVPESAPAAKLDAIRRHGAEIIVLSDDEWWHVIQSARRDNENGIYIDAVRGRAALTGNATLGVEIAEQVPEADAVVVPFGGGGLACGTGIGLRHAGSAARLIVAECDAAAPVAAALAEGRPVNVPVEPTFITGAGAPAVLDEMWPLVESLVTAAASATVTEVENAILRMLADKHIVAEGAGAIGAAAVLAGRVQGAHVVCVVSGGNIGIEEIDRIVHGHTASGQAKPPSL